MACTYVPGHRGLLFVPSRASGAGFKVGGEVGPEIFRVRACGCRDLDLQLDPRAVVKNRVPFLRGL